MFAFLFWIIMVCVGIAYFIDLLNKNENSHNDFYYRNQHYSRNEYEEEDMILWEEDEGDYYPDEHEYEDDLADRWGPMH